MKTYGQQLSDQTSVLDKCILDAFKNEYYEQYKILNDKIASNSLEEVVKNEPIFKSFNLARGNQLFMFKGSRLFDESTLLFHNINNIDKESIICEQFLKTKKSISAKSRQLNILPDKSDNLFDLMELDSTMSYFDAVKFGYEMQKTSNGLLYGILLKKDGIFINPFHPLIAQSLVRKHEKKEATAEYKALLDNQYKVFIYTYNDTNINDSNIDLNHDKLKDTFKDHIFKVLAMLEQSFSSSYIITSVNNTRTHSSSELTPYIYRSLEYNYIEKFTDEMNKYDINIEPVQLVNNGLVYPYYGIVAQKHSASTSIRGYQLSPMLSPNINNFSGYINKNNDGVESYEISAGSVCTGNLRNNSEAGWLSLNHANLNSSYFKNILSVGSFTFAKLCLDTSLNIYASFIGFEPLDLDMKPKPIPISFATFKARNEEKSFKDYIQYCKDQGN